MIEIKYKAVYYFYFLENSVQTKVSFSYVAYSIFLSSNLRYKTKIIAYINNNNFYKLECIDMAIQMIELSNL